MFNCSIRLNFLFINAVVLNANSYAYTRKVLFLGNSYTASNNLPLIISNFAASVNDTLIYDFNTPGGYTLDQHYADTNSTNKIIAGGWDYVVMQEQSQLPSFEDYYSGGPSNLSWLINRHNPCKENVLHDMGTEKWRYSELSFLAAIMYILGHGQHA